MRKLISFLFSGIGTLFSAAIFLIITFLPEEVGRIEGGLFPVVSNLKIDVMEKNPTISKVTGSFYINRPNCEFNHIEWKLITPNRRVLADVKFAEGTVSRQGGFNRFGPWYVTMEVDEIERRSIAEVFHDCPWRPWPTITHFYP